MSFNYHYTSHPLSNPKRAASFLSQQKMWVNANLEKIRIKDMDLEYVVATMNWLLKRAPEVKFMLELYYRQNDAPADLRADFAALDPYGFMKDTRLFVRLLERFDKLSTEFRKPAVVERSYDTVDDEAERAYYG